MDRQAAAHLPVGGWHGCASLVVDFTPSPAIHYGGFRKERSWIQIQLQFPSREPENLHFTMGVTHRWYTIPFQGRNTKTGIHRMMHSTMSHN
jgi:hypothetical protein